MRSHCGFSETFLTVSLLPLPDAGPAGRSTSAASVMQADVSSLEHKTATMMRRRERRVRAKAVQLRGQPRTEHWTALSLSLVVHIMTWLDSYSLMQMQATCRVWNALPGERTDRIWRPLYMHDFEVCGECMLQQDGMSWRKRYSKRGNDTFARIKRKWMREQAPSESMIDLHSFTLISQS